MTTAVQSELFILLHYNYLYFQIFCFYDPMLVTAMLSFIRLLENTTEGQQTVSALVTQTLCHFNNPVEIHCSYINVQNSSK